MLHVEVDQAITRKMTTNVFTEPYPLFHENDLGAFFLYYIKCYLSEGHSFLNFKSEANQTVCMLLKTTIAVRNEKGGS